MVSRLRKIRRQRGSRSHGWGQVKGHRSHPAGRGNAGLMKYKWSWTVKYDPDHFGKPHLNPPNRKIVSKWINVGQINGLFSNSSEQTLSKINLTELGYEKLLGSGKISGSFEIVIKSYSQTAKDKVEKAGGKLLWSAK